VAAALLDEGRTGFHQQVEPLADRRLERLAGNGVVGPRGPACEDHPRRRTGYRAIDSHLHLSPRLSAVRKILVTSVSPRRAARLSAVSPSAFAWISAPRDRSNFTSSTASPS